MTDRTPTDDQLEKIGLTREQFEILDAGARKHLDKPLAYCTPDDLRTVASIVEQEAEQIRARSYAQIDQARAAIRDVADCGCQIVGEDLGEGVPANPRPMHACGKELQ